MFEVVGEVTEGLLCIWCCALHVITIHPYISAFYCSLVNLTLQPITDVLKFTKQLSYQTNKKTALKVEVKARSNFKTRTSRAWNTNCSMRPTLQPVSFFFVLLTALPQTP